MFNKLSRMKSHHQTIFAIVILFAIISFWRGIQGLMDMYLIPDNYEMSLWSSVAIGLGILIAAHYVAS